MAMPWVENLSDPQELRRCVRDLVALSTMPAIWTGYHPRQIADSLAAVLVSMLDADFVYVAVPASGGEPVIEVAHAGNKTTASPASAIRPMVRRASLACSGQVAAFDNPFGEGALRVATAPIGFNSDAVVAAGSSQEGFPTEPQRLLLGIAANDATMALHRWQAEADERRFVALIERSSDFVGVASLDGRPQFINPIGLDLVGLSASEDLSQLHILDFLVPEDRPHARDDCWSIVNKAGRWVGELTFRHFKTGEAMPFLVDWFRIDNPRNGRPMNIATVSRDLRGQKQAEFELRRLNESLERRVSERTVELKSAKEKMEAEMLERERADVRLQELQLELSHAGRLSAAGQMAAAFAHELNQPLTAVANSANAARRLLVKNEREKIGTVCEIMEEIAEQSLRAGQILRRLREFVAHGETEKRVESVETMIEEASAFAQTGFEATGVQTQFKFDPNASEVFANRIQVQQVLVNVMRNAFEAMAAGKERELKVTTGRLDEETIEVAVADSGPGLAPEVAGRLFEPFVSTKRDGMGLGLSICRSIVEAHGGRLWSEPNPGGGTIFRFTLLAATGERHAG